MNQVVTRMCRVGASRAVATAISLTFALWLSSGQLSASDCCDPKSPFRPGEGWADDAATCETLDYWAKLAPKTDDRVSMIIRGRLSGVESSDVLAYLEMCEPKALRVVCVTYKTNGMRKGDVVTFAGGFRRGSEEWVVLDPCLASR
jgi:hypothetical protein